MLLYRVGFGRGCPRRRLHRSAKKQALQRAWLSGSRRSSSSCCRNKRGCYLLRQAGSTTGRRVCFPIAADRFDQMAECYGHCAVPCPGGCPPEVKCANFLMCGSTWPPGYSSTAWGSRGVCVNCDMCFGGPLDILAADDASVEECCICFQNPALVKWDAENCNHRVCAPCFRLMKWGPERVYNEGDDEGKDEGADEEVEEHEARNDCPQCRRVRVSPLSWQRGGASAGAGGGGAGAGAGGGGGGGGASAGAGGGGAGAGAGGGGGNGAGGIRSQ